MFSTASALYSVGFDNHLRVHSLDLKETAGSGKIIVGSSRRMQSNFFCFFPAEDIELTAASKAHAMDVRSSDDAKVRPVFFSIKKTGEKISEWRIKQTIKKMEQAKVCIGGSDSCIVEVNVDGNSQETVMWV